MKKLVAVLFVVAMAVYNVGFGAPYDLTMKKETITTTVTVPTQEISEREYNKLWREGNQYLEKKYSGGKTKYYYKEHQETQITTQKVATTHDYTNALGTTGLEYTVTYNNKYYNTSNYFSHLYFSTKDMNLAEGEVLAVQFMGAEISNHGGDMSKFDVLDYGIYLYDPDQAIEDREYLSIGKNKNYFAIGPDQDFGIYYVNKEGETITSTENFAANFDGDDHEIKIYSETVGGVTTQYPEGKIVTTNKRYMCMLETEKMVHPHWEFMLQTTIDNPYYGVNPEDFTGNGSTDVTDATSGQPLPGTLATLLIGGLCAGSLRKRNKKH